MLLPSIVGLGPPHQTAKPHTTAPQENVAQPLPNPEFSLTIITCAACHLHSCALLGVTFESLDASMEPGKLRFPPETQAERSVMRGATSQYPWTLEALPECDLCSRNC
jgi:hypothetical protein